ncbi:S9 family peptidase [Ferrimonas balearica]|uniref:S9 family peptidase n=1 Tax=Ferrimonas balearica TaxID=44012 RepID=UPI001C571CCF|nr:S9 family peptidase [Ferrimonas balearica]MBW3139692.1 S9 family peptidase [Ferrimonas balearica]
MDKPLLNMTMKNTVLALSWCASSLVAAAAQAETLTIERLFADPKLAGATPRALTYSPDGSRVTYLKGRDSDQHRYDLWEYHIGDNAHRLLVDADTLHQGDEALSDEEKARRERQRIYGSGIMEYRWSDDGQALLFPLAGDVFFYDLAQASAESKPRRLTETPGFETDIKVSPKGGYVSYVRDQNLYVVDLASGEERALTRDGGGAIKNGMAEFVAQEEMGRMTGYWWSPDDAHMAFIRVDESPVDEVTRSEIYADRIDMIQQRYPAAGRPNVTVKLGVVALADGNVRWLDLGKQQDIYLPRVRWANANQLSYQWQSRDQQTLELRLADIKNGETRVLLTERSDSWINLHEDLRFLKSARQFIWASERDGFNHLYLYGMNGKPVRQLTSGTWVVDKLEAVDEEKGLVFFTGRRDTPLERHLYRVRLDGEGKITRISDRPGMHSIKFAKDGSGYIDTFSDPRTPPQVSLHDARGNQLTWLEQNRVEPGHPLFPYLSDWVNPEFGTLRAPQGHSLYYRLYKPAGFDANKQYPAIVYLYGGPHAQLVTNSWDKPFHQYLAQQGYVVFTVDNRGSNYRGKAFETALYQNMGTPEVEDQVSGVKYLAGLPYVDPERIGVFGHSYGGYLSLMMMFKAGEHFAAGISGAPVTDWLLYDTHYTERYMGHPAKVPQAYERASVFPYAPALDKPLLIYHGMADDNVLFTNTTRLIKLLQDEGKQFDLMTYPGKKHSLRGEATRVHWHTMMADFFDRHLKPE